ncbi:hypothetical protein DFH94DRAFT_292386 [Russula ochroleuca]|uniref:Protein YAE1 n=1 Tax=Russula ochroleuca TaxID=152965 RepID=A0A9P5JW24_9AGAM|nr:hypothetical protein DFH94DRAFT_292386 [Russula ochroleuca]
MQDIDESPWDDTPSAGTTHVEAEWTKLSSSFQNAGYRDGITAGKESALQEGFDAGFAQTGAPLGRELGLLRGLASALLHHHLSRVAQQRQQQQQQQEEPGSGPTSAVREIVDALAAVRFADIAPPAPEEAGHTHCTVSEDVKSEVGEEGEEASPRSAGLGSAVTTIDDVRAFRVKLETLLRESGLKIDLNLEIF